MTSILKHKGYAARVEFDADDRIFFGHIAGIEDGVGFHSDTVDGLVAAFEEAVEDYLETCARAGKQPDKPYSGVVYLRVDPGTHAEAAIAAQLAGMSLNQFGEEALRKATKEQIAP
ncbi:MAG: type II toxin-antitoxin system HicB family antitoxin [Alphaproteobacteria bacterium]|nr:MAG: type II toxin-antitoxin system HicB family antitoxin [Alphaproteobacteria bacterium]